MEKADQWWTKDVARVIAETDTFYARLVEVAPQKTKLNLTKEKIIAAREWAPTLKMYQGHFDRVLSQLDFFYIPNRIVPGPTFVFPIIDIHGKYTSAQTRPIESSVLYATSAKYRYIGESKPAGPRWLGNDHATLKKIIDTRSVLIVEGPFDLLAARLVCPDVPSLSPLTKVLGNNHKAYLRMLGVRKLALMYDNEMAKKAGQKDGAGNVSAEYQAATIKNMTVTNLVCPLEDPSLCLKYQQYAEKLRSRISAEF
jgi:hypothetical protein